MRAQLARPEMAATVRAGATVTIPVGSRGIANLVVNVRELVAAPKARGAHPFIFPTMGSHGGATAEGQRGVIEGYGAPTRRWALPSAQSWRRA